MKVIHINDKRNLAGGVEIYISQLQPLLRNAGWESDLVAVNTSGSAVSLRSDNKSLDWQGPVASLASSPIADAVSNRDVLFHVHSLSKPAVLTTLFSLAPVVRTMHEPRMFCPGQGKFWVRSERVCTQPAGLHCFYHAYKERCCNRHPKRLWPAFRNSRFEVNNASQMYAKILANSMYMRDEAILAGIPREQVELLHYFTTHVDDVSGSSDENRIVFAGRLSRTKGVHHLLEAMKLVLASVPNAHLDLLGDGIDREAFVGLAKNLGLSDQTTFHGWADRVKVDEYLKRATVVAFPSIYPEAFGIVGIEAMARGKPVVAFDVGGVKDWLEDQVTGVLVAAGDVWGLAEGLIKFLSDKQEYTRMGKAGRAKAKSEFSEALHLGNLIRVYEAAMGA